MRPLRIIACALAVFPTAAFGLTPQLLPPLCAVDRATGMLHDLDAGIGEPLFFYDRPGGAEVVSYTYESPEGREVAVLQACEVGLEVWIAFPENDNFAAFNAYSDMYHADEDVTFAEIAETLRALNADVRETENALGACLCDALALS